MTCTDLFNRIALKHQIAVRYINGSWLRCGYHCGFTNGWRFMTLNTYEFGSDLKKFGYNFYSGVPCSFLKYLINYAINDCDYVMAANEGDAVAIASGANLGGRKSVVLMQNSGLTNAISPLTSLNYTFEIPVLGFVSPSWRARCGR